MNTILSLLYGKKRDADADSVLLQLANDINSTRSTLADLHSARLASTRHVTYWLLSVWLVYVAVFVAGRKAGVELAYNLWAGVPVLCGLGPVFGARSVVAWYYSRQIRWNESKLQTHILSRNKTLDNVKESKSYNDAQRILALYGGGAPSPAASSSNKPSTEPTVAAMGTPKSQLPTLTTTTPSSNVSRADNSSVRGNSATPSKQSRRGKPFKLADDTAPSSPSTRHWADRLTNVLLGPDSPAQLPPFESYALICSKCAEHNGLVEADRRAIRWACRACGHPNGASPPSLSPSLTKAAQMPAVMPQSKTAEKLMKASPMSFKPTDEDELMSED